MQQIIFDLDGTISDPIVGTGNCLNYALTELGCAPISLTDVGKYIGPPLNESFREITGSDAHVESLIAKYRDRYAEIGYSENVIYPGVREMLGSIDGLGISMAMCTFKRQDLAESILEMFEISHYFQWVSGGVIGRSKSEQLRFERDRGLVSPSSIMVGDRATDLIAARENGLEGAGVLWGYGSRDELERESPLHLFASPRQVVKLLGDRFIRSET